MERRFFSLPATSTWCQGRGKEKFRLWKKILLSSGHFRLVPGPGKGEISAVKEDSSPFRAARMWRLGREKEKFRNWKKILLPSGRSHGENRPGKGEISAWKEDSSPFRAAGWGASLGPGAPPYLFSTMSCGRWAMTMRSSFSGWTGLAR